MSSKYYLINVVITLVAALVTGPIIIPLLRKFEIGQTVREDGPKSHYKKSGTPTMGGIIFILALLIGLVVRGEFKGESLILLLSTLGFGLVGFLDDFLIVVRKDNEGLRPKQKLAGQVILALVLSYIYYKSGSRDLIIPFAKNKTLNLGVVYILFMAFVMVGTVNSVNLTDGLDGLASGVTVFVLIFFTIVANRMGKLSVASFSSLLIGGLIGFLRFNFHPAKVFMGDTGSMALGGAVAAVAMILDMPLFIPIVGGIYFIEALPVIIQVTVHKKYKKRVFLMAPLHHHFEHKGWKELKVVAVFWSVTILLCLLGYLGL